MRPYLASTLFLLAGSSVALAAIDSSFTIEESIVRKNQVRARASSSAPNAISTPHSWLVLRVGSIPGQSIACRWGLDSIPLDELSPQDLCFQQRVKSELTVGPVFEF
jgi:hypothetical protein